MQNLNVTLISRSNIVEYCLSYINIMIKSKYILHRKGESYASVFTNSVLAIAEELNRWISSNCISVITSYKYIQS